MILSSVSVIRVTIGVDLKSVAGDLEKHVDMQEYIPQLERASTPLVGAQASACDRACVVRVFCIAPVCLFVRTCLFCLHLGAKSCVFSAAARLLVGSIRLSSVVGSSVCYR